MTQAFENMLFLFGAAATGKKIDIKYCDRLSEIHNCARSQKVWEVIYAALKGKIEDGSIAVLPDVYIKLEKSFLSNVAMNIRRTEFNLSTVRRLEEKGIKCCVLKGIAVASFYAVPETRISSDVDILIDKKNEKKTVKILKELGYKCEKRPRYDHHMKAFHETGGLLEVHVALHSNPTSDIVFNDKVHYNEEFVLTGDGFYSLGVNDSLLFLSAHLINHLINDATGLRQMMDLLLYMKAYENEIDWEKYNSLMKKLGYDNLIAVVKGIGVKYFGMEFEGAVTEGNGMDELLEDCEIGGVFGFDEGDRSQFFHAYNKRRSKMGKKAFLIYNMLNSEKSLVRTFFPTLKSMEKKYRYVKRYPFLLPVGWFHRMLELCFGLGKGNEEFYEGKNKNDMIKRRMEMIEKLGMIKE